MTTIIDNPAKRLLELLIGFKTLQGQTTVRSAIQEVMGIKGASDPLIADGLLELTQLAVRTERIIRALDNVNAALLLAPFERIYRFIFRMDFDTQIQNIWASIDDFVLHGLRHCVDAIDRNATLVDMSEEDLNVLSAEVNEIIDFVVQSDMDSDLKKVILQRLSEIQRAILSYRVGGSEGLRKAAESGFALIFEQADKISASKAKEAIFRFGKLAMRILDIVHTGIKLNELTGGSIGGLLGIGK